MATKHSIPKTISEIFYKTTFNSIKTNLLLIEQESYLSDTQKLNLMYWKIGETLLPHKPWHKPWSIAVIDDLCQNLNNEFPSLPSFSNNLLMQSMEFYTTYHDRPITSQQLKGIHIYTLSAGAYLSLLLRHVFKPSKPLTLNKLAKKLPIFSLPWQQNLMLLRKVNDPIDKLWYAQKASDWKADDATLRTWIDHQLVSHTAEKDDHTTCRGNSWFSSYCKKCKSIGHGRGLRTWSLFSWMFLLGLLIMELSSSLLQDFLKNIYKQ